MAEDAKLQKEYDNFCAETISTKQDELCGNNHVFDLEKLIISKILNAKSILDIGCGTGHRMFDYYKKENIRFKGVEKFINLIDSSRYKDEIVNADLGSDNFLNDLNNKLNGFEYDAIVCFGGVVNGFLEYSIKEFGWENLFSLSKGKCPLVVSFISKKEVFDVSDVGTNYQLDDNFPHQYLYSKLEILNILKLNNINVKYIFQEYTYQDFILVFLVIGK